MDAFEDFGAGPRVCVSPAAGSCGPLRPVRRRYTLLTHADARSLGRALMAHADAAEGPEAGRERLLGNVRAHFGTEAAVDVERLRTGRPS